MVHTCLRIPHLSIISCSQMACHLSRISFAFCCCSLGSGLQDPLPDPGHAGSNAFAAVLQCCLQGILFFPLERTPLPIGKNPTSLLSMQARLLCWLQVWGAIAAQLTAHHALLDLPATCAGDAVSRLPGRLDAFHVPNAKQWHPRLPS